MAQNQPIRVFGIKLLGGNDDQANKLRSFVAPEANETSLDLYSAGYALGGIDRKSVV